MAEEIDNFLVFFLLFVLIYLSYVYIDKAAFVKCRDECLSVR